MLKPKKNEIRKPSRTASGITPIAVMLPPRRCKHGTCLYCPSLNVPQSYTPKSPAVLRAKMLNYDAYKQVKARIEAFDLMNHPTEKIELIIMGGTFLQYPKDFQYKFIKGCYDGLNGKKSKNLVTAQKINEKAKHRCVALCIETRPDVCCKFIDRLLEFGATRVELGVQCLDDTIYRKINRGHDVEEVIGATKRLKDAGFKVFYHFMVNLPGSNFKHDIIMFKKLFHNENFRPDGMKIYPCQVIKGSKLVELYRKGKYAPYSERKLIDLLIKMKLAVPKYCRISRIMREIPLSYLVAGTKKIDLRNILEKEMLARNLKCQCTRCREIGFALRKNRKINKNYIKLCRLDYKASKGHEIFLSYEDVKNDILIAILRLRISGKPFRHEISKETALIRELHTYGSQIPINSYSKEDWQHKGYGKLLLKEAERIAKEEFNIKKIIIISGIGAREYFYKQDYKMDGYYVSKML